MEVLLSIYPWTKAFHIISVIAWMAGLLYLPRLFIYHLDTIPGELDSERFKVMERKLLRVIMNSAMISTYVFGIALLLTPGIVDWGSGWIYVKLGSVAALTVLHHLFALWHQQLSVDQRPHSVRFFRFANELPAVMMILIVIMVVVRPI